MFFLDELYNKDMYSELKYWKVKEVKLVTDLHSSNIM